MAWSISGATGAVGIVRRYMMAFQVKSQVPVSKNHPTSLNRGYENFPLQYPRDLRKWFFQVFQLHLQKNVVILRNPYLPNKFSAGTDHSSSSSGTSHLFGPPYSRASSSAPQRRLSPFSLTTSPFHILTPKQRPFKADRPVGHTTVMQPFPKTVSPKESGEAYGTWIPGA
jgi:hypothetical protein